MAATPATVGAGPVARRPDALAPVSYRPGAFVLFGGVDAGPTGPDLGRVSAPPNPAGPRVPRGVNPAVFRLYLALAQARGRLAYATAEARLLDGLARYVRLECGASSTGVPLTDVGPRWAELLGAVAATARLCSAESQALLAPWTVLVGGVGGGAAPAPGVSPHAGIDFRAYGT